MRKKPSLFFLGLLSVSMLASTAAMASSDDHHSHKYKVTITNLTPGQPLAPIMVATHRPGFAFFEEGDAPSDELARLAEAGDGQPMADKLSKLKVVDQATVSTTGLTLPGKSTTVMISAKRAIAHISVAAMLGATNDAFFAIKDAALPWGRRAVTYMAPAYDAGSETNDELSSTVAGLGGEGYSPNDSGEGFIHIHGGVHGIGNLNPATMDWRNPVAKITIERVK
jgi:hypothetical protein